MSKTQFIAKSISPRRLLGTLAALVIAFILLVSVVSVAQKYFFIRKHIKELTAEQAELEQKKANLDRMNAYLATPEGAEYALRDKYNVVKPGEGVIMVVESPTQAPEVKRSAVSRWWHAIVRGLGLKKE